MNTASPHLKTFIAQCVQGDIDARRAFQRDYGPLIYTFPVRIFHMSEDEAGDFYLYVYENDRIFKRIRSFEGRNDMQFETYLSYFVLRDLLLEWLRTVKQVETVSLETPVMRSAISGDGEKTLQDVLPAAVPSPEASLAEADDIEEARSILARLDLEKRLILKLLALGEVELEPEDVRLVAQTAKRSLLETLDLLKEILTGLSAKGSRTHEKRERLHAVSTWILTYQRRIEALDEALCANRAQDHVKTEQTLIQEKAELERKLAWRYRQQARLRQELQRSESQPSYRDIARLLNISVGTVGSRIARAREEFWRKLTTARQIK